MNSTNVVEPVVTPVDVEVLVSELAFGDSSPFQNVFDTGEYTTDSMSVNCSRQICYNSCSTYNRARGGYK